LNYQIEWHPETFNEFSVFSKDFRRTIKRKVENIAANIPASLKLRSVQPVKWQDTINVAGTLYELDIASGAKVAFCVDDERRVLTVYMVGKHDYAYSNYLTLASERLKVDNRYSSR
jgi:mRNA-degrading endonuclease RelE of RelBE toxin-antitoxin system